ncbi:hypothetical protein Vau01_124070 [Virgisporangium aurantiacum]|uniref:TIR domain-containing protein n=1 Tax=Virgisporangium aurantiacum TaxID=175570 RepID=A0A8J3ZJF9_9ACTN|nr:hypothetical protein Vau01_124070 [Virgisporangium aurantiacum]
MTGGCAGASLGIVAELASVFLSYGRGDDEPFVARLRDGLEDAGASVWFDRVSLPSRALTFVQEIRDAIESHDRVVVVLGPRALTSDYVEAEWRYALEAAKVVIPVLLRVPPSTRICDAVPRDLNRLHVVDARERADDVVLAEVVRHLREPEPILGNPLHVPPPPPHYQPRPLDYARLEAALQLDSPRRLTALARERTLVLHGMGGVGKSVAAAAVARNIHVRRQFPGGVVWVDLGRDADVLAGLRRIGAAVADDLREYTRVEDTTARLARRIGALPLLVVADNAWSDDDLRPFVAVMGSATHLLVTTRDGGIATRLGAVPIAIEPLTRDKAMQHLAAWVGEAVDGLPDSALRVADDCGGLPLALSLVGAMARGGTPWSDIAAAIEEADLGFVREQLPEYPYPDLLRALRVSLDSLERSGEELERVAATCFRNLAALRWDRPIPEATLVTLWSARAQLPERRARRVLSVLVTKALLRAEGESPNQAVSMHDLLHDLARTAIADMATEHRAFLDAYQARHPDAPFIADDGYYLDHFVHHLHAAGRADKLPEILCRETASGSNAWWSIRLRHGQVSGYVADLRRAWADASDAGDTAALVRWALMIASVRSAIGEVPADFAALALEYDVWTPAQALAAADWATGRDRFDMLVAVLPVLDPIQQATIAQEAALIARQEPEDRDRTWRLLRLAGAVEGPARRRFVREAVPPEEPLSEFVDSWLLLDAYRLDPERIDAADAAVAWAENRFDEGLGWITVAHVAAEAPLSHLSRVRQMADRLPAPADRLRVLLALAERTDQPTDELIQRAEDELAQLGDAQDAHVLDARLAPYRPTAERDAAAYRIVHARGEWTTTDRLDALLAVLPYASGVDRDRAEREVVEILEHADRTEAEALTSGIPARRLRATEPELFAMFVTTALKSVEAVDARWSRISMLVRLLPEADDDRIRAVVEEQARRILTINDAGDRAKCIATYCERLGADAAQHAAGDVLRRMIERLPADDLAMHAPPLLAHAGESDLVALQTAVGAEADFPLDLRPALFGAWARHGNWDRATDTLVDGSSYEWEPAIDPLADRIPQHIAEELIHDAVRRSNARFYSAVVPLAPRARTVLHGQLLENWLRTVEALDLPHDRLHLIERLAPLLPADALPQLAGMIPDDEDSMDRDPTLLTLVRAMIANGDPTMAAQQIGRIEMTDYKCQAALAVADAVTPHERVERLDFVENEARALPRPEQVELLVAVARRSDEPKRTRLLREATRAAEKPLAEGAWYPETRAHALRVVAAAHEGTERERLLLEAWDAVPKSGSYTGRQCLVDLAPLMAEASPAAVRPRWERSLEAAVRSRPTILIELTALVDVVLALGRDRTAAEIVTALDDIDRWWP